MKGEALIWMTMRCAKHEDYVMSQKTRMNGAEELTSQGDLRQEEMSLVRRESIHRHIFSIF
jgi:hypothetical protein